jgi:hypothetical protein
MLSLPKFCHGLSALVTGALVRLDPTVIKRSSMLFSFGLPSMVLALSINANCSDPFVSTLEHGLGTIISVLMALGIAIAVIGIVVGGLMRATAWGSEQRIAMSNKAITCAVVGLVIVLLGVTLGGEIPAWFGNAGGSCTQNLTS